MEYSAACNKGSMCRKSFVPQTIALVCLLTSIGTSQVMAANMRSFIEAVRRKAAVVYVGSVKEVRLLTRTKFDIFANSFASTIPPGYLMQGSREELLQRVVALRDSLSRMSPDQLRVNEINEEDRRIQLELYEKLSAYLRTSK